MNFINKKKLSISKNIYLSLESSLFYFRFGIFAIAISLLIDKNKNLTKNFFFSLLGAFILISIDGYFQFITGKNILEYSIRYSVCLG